MKRLMLVPLVACGLLAGCVTGDYAYRGGDRGDYYYGRPGVEYRYYGPYGFDPYGYYGGYGGYGGYGRPYVYGRGYYGGFGYYGTPYYGNPYYGYPYRYPFPPQHPRPPQTPPPQGPSPRPDVRGDEGDAPPWRALVRRPRGDGDMRPAPVPSRPMPAERGERAERGDSRMGQMIERAIQRERDASADER